MAQHELHENRLTIEAYPDKAQYRPGERVFITVAIQNGLEEDVRGKLEIRISYLFTQIAVLTKEIALKARAQKQFSFVWMPLSDGHLKGYGVDAQLVDPHGQILAETSTAFDVAPDWTRSPRYGFLCDFTPDEEDTEKRLLTMNKFHINVIQFYDWLHRHDTLLPTSEEFQDPLGRRLSLKTIQNKIALAHQHNMAAMAYTSVYGASKEFFLQHKDWALYRPDGKAWTLDLQTYGDFLYIMNPGSESGWRKHLLEQFQVALEVLNFDGIHIDQYGDPRVAFDEAGHLVDLAPIFTSFIEETKRALCRKGSDAKVVFNAVNNWPIRAVARASQDIVYVEVWPPHVTYQDLAAIISQGRALSNEKKCCLGCLHSSCLGSVRTAG